MRFSVLIVYKFSVKDDKPLYNVGKMHSNEIWS